MLHPSYTELMAEVNSRSTDGEPVIKSRYSIVMGTARRARQLVDNGYMKQDDHSVKPLSIAVDELHTGKIRILTEAEKAEKEAELAAKEAFAEETEAFAEGDTAEDGASEQE